ncbi:MAG TPA: histidine kinase N-terminal domain-containing protein [Acidimicrobiia bacterium]|jgi:two-component sensor histidine kinase
MTFEDIAHTRTTLNRRALAHVRRLASTWRPLADLSFSDLLLLGSLEGDEGHRFVVLAQLRPTTGQTLYPTDMVGTIVDEIERPMLTRVWRLGEIVESDTSALGSKERVRVQVVPVRDGDELVGLLTREYVPNLGRRPGELERTYLEVFQRLARMVADGVFPFLHDEEEFEGAPRVGDGVLVLDADTRVRFASPNAVSAMHRMGIHAYAQGMRLAEIGFDDAPIVAAFDDVQPVLEEVERNDVVVAVRAIPLVDAAEVTGAIVLMRDVTDVRRRDRMLMSKDATIREIHHRVKNNLQTIASLLRLQRRRLTSGEARSALAESERRIRSIAIVHETLSRDAGDVVDFTEIVKPLVREVEESVSSADLSIHFTVDGEGGNLPGEVATPLAVVLNELMQNAVDHAFIERSKGTVHVVLTRRAEQLEIDVSDDGVGLPHDFTLDASTGLGLSIVKALVTGELGGSIEMRANRPGSGGSGTKVHVRVPVSAPRVEV